MKAILLIALSLAPLFMSVEPVIKRRVCKPLKIDGQTIYVDSVWTYGKRTFFVGRDGINYGIKTKQTK